MWSRGRQAVLETGVGGIKGRRPMCSLARVPPVNTVRGGSGDLLAGTPPAKPARPGSAHGLLAKQTQSAVVPEQGGGSCWSRAGEEQAEGAFDWEVSWGWERWEERSRGEKCAQRTGGEFSNDVNSGGWG